MNFHMEYIYVEYIYNIQLANCSYIMCSGIFVKIYHVWLYLHPNTPMHAYIHKKYTYIYNPITWCICIYIYGQSNHMWHMRYTWDIEYSMHKYMTDSKNMQRPHSDVCSCMFTHITSSTRLAKITQHSPSQLNQLSKETGAILVGRYNACWCFRYSADLR